MSLNIRNEEVNRLGEKLATLKRMNKTEVVRFVLENELRRADAAMPMRERLRPQQDRVAPLLFKGDDFDKTDIRSAGQPR